MQPAWPRRLPGAKGALRDLWWVIRKNVPGLKESMDHGVPVYEVGGEMICAFASRRQSVGFCTCDEKLLHRYPSRLEGAYLGKSCVRYRKPESRHWMVLGKIVRDAFSGEKGPKKTPARRRGWPVEAPEPPWNGKTPPGRMAAGREEPCMVQLKDKDTGTLLGEITEEELQFLIDMLEEESDDDRDYFLTGDTLDLLRREGATESLMKLLVEGMGDRGELEIEWSRGEG